MKTLKFFKSFYKSCDVFAQPITLTFYQERRFSTFIGAMLTLSMITLISFIAVNKIDGVMNHKNLIASSQESIQSIPPSIRINNMLAFAFEPVIFNSLKGKVYFDYKKYTVYFKFVQK